MIESFNVKFRDECFTMEWFHSQMEANVVIEDSRSTYNEVRPYSSLGNKTPGAYARRSVTLQPREPASILGWYEKFRQVTPIPGSITPLCDNRRQKVGAVFVIEFEEGSNANNKYHCDGLLKVNLASIGINRTIVLTISIVRLFEKQLARQYR